MKKLVFLIPLFIQLAHAQNNKVLFTIDNDKVYVDEFERVYTKNNINNQADYSKASLDEYLDLFINFKLKVKEAEQLQMDTITSIKNELNSYNKQLISSYINDKEVTEELVKEAYDRSTEEVDVSHILVRWPNDYPSAKDTATTLKKIQDIKKGLTPKNFADVAKAKSEDPSAKENNGRLGYLTVFQTVYPFENAMYNTPIGKISEPVATRFGYHLVLVHDKRPARGKITTAHILIKSKETDTPENKAIAKQEAQKIYAQISSGEISFEDAAKKYSQDTKTKNQGGVLPALSSAEMLSEYADAAFSIKKDGGIAAPVLSAIGWHIIKRISKEEILPYNESKKILEMSVSRDMRSNVALQKNIEDSKNKFGYTENRKAIDKTISLLANSYKNKAYSVENQPEEVLFKIGTAPITNNLFIDYAKREALRIKNDDAIESVLHNQFNDFRNDKIEKYREKNLAQINEDYKNLLQEYHDGILLFELTNKEVWNKAVEDTAGLEAYYKEHRNNYMWQDRVSYNKYTFENSTAADKGIKLLDKGKNFENISKKLNKKEKQVSVQTVKAEKEHFNVAGLEWKTGSTVTTEENGKKVVYKVNEILKPEPKALEETKGYVISDYQNRLEKDWINTLKNKYKVSVNNDVFQSLIKK